MQCRPHTLTPTPAHAVDDNKASEDEDDEDDEDEDDDEDDTPGSFTPEKVKERVGMGGVGGSGGVSGGRAVGKQPASGKKRAREAEGGKKKGGVSRKKPTIKLSGDGAGNASLVWLDAGRGGGSGAPRPRGSGAGGVGGVGNAGGSGAPRPRVGGPGAGGAGVAAPPPPPAAAIRGPFDYDEKWGKRSCTLLKCPRLDQDPVSETYKAGEPCGGLCRRSSAYQYCQANNIVYHKFPDGKFYDPEKYK